MSLAQWILALGGIAGPALVLMIIHQRGLRGRFPFFFNYLMSYIAISCLGVAAYLYNCDFYFYVYWILAIFMMTMEFWVIYEVLANTLKAYSALVDLASVLFRWAAVFLLLTALITALATNGAQGTKLEAAMSVVEHSIRLMQCGLLLFLLVFETRLGVSWRNYGMGIAIGIGIAAAVDLTISYLRMLSWRSSTALDAVNGTVYLGVIAFWGCVLVMREPTSKSILDSPSRLIFQRWNEALMATPLISRKNQAAFAPVESFLPGVEQTVERVMARKMMH